MDSLDHMQREELLRGAVLAGDENAWQTWYNESFCDLYEFVRWRCGGRRDWADEIVQETWLTAVRRIRHFNPREGNFLAWLRGIAANLLRNHVRKQRKRFADQQSHHDPAGNDGTAQSQYSRQLETQQQEEQVAVALDALSDREEAVLRAKYLDGLSVAEIAAKGGETVGAIESLLSRARRAFRQVYRGLEE